MLLVHIEAVTSNGLVTEGGAKMVWVQVRVERIEIGPNPVQAELQIGLELLQGAELQIDLLDLTGRTVQNLSTERVLSGAFVRNFQVDQHLADGMYLLRLKVNGQVETRKLMLRK